MHKFSSYTDASHINHSNTTSEINLNQSHINSPIPLGIQGRKRSTEMLLIILQEIIPTATSCFNCFKACVTNSKFCFSDRV